uniref:Putative reverse transcriptase domain-containing protein n=1 Tax=Tanacetum cinerariifolium TaxID=118510 RepID=A0A699H0G0_TANCI|nr:putative reverse transcriptase domain-containing protein [Tanacetum cinerariifolium]
MKLFQGIQPIQKLRDDQKRMKKVSEVMSGSYVQKSNQDGSVEKTSMSSSAARNIVTNSHVTPSWREIVSLIFSEAGVLHVNWTRVGQCVSHRVYFDQPKPPEKVCFDPCNTYRLRLPLELSCVHDVFHVSNLKKCIADSDLQVPLEEIMVDDKLYLVEEPVEFMDRQVKKLKRSRIPIIKVRWDSRRGAEFT